MLRRRTRVRPWIKRTSNWSTAGTMGCMARSDGTLDPRIQGWIDALGSDRWAALAMDADDRLIWVSGEMRTFLGEDDPEKIGIGQHFAAALLSETWRGTMTEASQIDVFNTAMPLWRGDMTDEVIDAMPEPFGALVRDVKPMPRQLLVAGSFDYIFGGLPPYRVEYLVIELRDDAGSRIGSIAITNQGLRPTLLAMLSRGDEAMYERMSRLVQPSRHATAILFADLEGSGELSRQLPSSRYFELVRELATSFDELVARECGIVGKHVGDGMTAFFLTDDLGGPSQAAAACLRTARAMKAAAATAAKRLAEEGLALAASPEIRAGLHWGANLYLGQLVPGGRLDVTALGDEVNECARIEAMARGGRILASKQLIESMTDEDARALKLDVEHVVYQPLAALPDATDKAIRDAGGVAVTDVT
jgi:class 3 adenylate cyclase